MKDRATSVRGTTRYGRRSSTSSFGTGPNSDDIIKTRSESALTSSLDNVSFDTVLSPFLDLLL